MTIENDQIIFSSSTISDALEKVTGIRGALNSSIRPLFSKKLSGPAVTVLNVRTAAPKYPIDMMVIIDSAAAGSVIVAGFAEPAVDVSGWGGLLTQAAAHRGIAGAIIEAPARDIDEIKQIGFPVFCNGSTPCTGAGRYTASRPLTPITLGGVLISPGDFIVADNDGVVAVPKEYLESVLLEAAKIDALEAQMVLKMKETGSIEKAFQLVARI